MTWTDEEYQAAHRRLMVAVDERNQLRAAIAEHHAQKADDRCIEDDDRLYAAAGLPPVQITGHVFQRCFATRPGDEHRADGCKNANRCHWVSPHDCAACGALPEEHLAA